MSRLEKTHKVVKSEERTDNGIDYTTISSNLFMKAGDEKTIRDYFSNLHLRSLKYTKEDTLRDCPMITVSKNSIRYHTLRDTIITFSVKKLTPKEITKYN
jgi:hypothetical protein